VAQRHGVEHAAVDVLDPTGLAELLRGADVVLSAVGPFYRFGTTVLRAAIESGTSYVDVADDPAPTLQMLALDPAARAAGVSAIVGAGASPGLSNLLAVARRASSTPRHGSSPPGRRTPWPTSWSSAPRRAPRPSTGCTR
jgi:saccharopine dehydrogenase-like NADP-dependent oxidoreductase